MIRHYHAVREAAKHIAGAINRSVEALRDGRVEQEPAMTDRMLGKIEESLDNYRVNGIVWSAKTLTDRGPGTQENRYGADFMGVLNITLPDFHVAKGFLAQAKLVRPHERIKLKELRGQCEKMLELSPDSFVFLYSLDDVRVVPALSVLSSNVDPTELYYRSAQRFFEDHFECFIGDRNISVPNSDTLKNLASKFEARRTILLQARDDHSIDPDL